jgi:molybdenum cofactor cytidylyltransferase
MESFSSTLKTGDRLYSIVLAGGASTRFGSPKQLVRVGGRPLLHTVVTRAAVVLGAGAGERAPLLRHSPGSVVINRHWREGLASSIRAGVARLPATCAGVLLVLADQAAVTSDDLRRLAGTWRRRPQSIAAALYAGTTGVPAIFPRTAFAELASLRGDSGARQVLRRSPDRLVRVPMPSAELDLDTPEDLLRLAPPESGAP